MVKCLLNENANDGTLANNQIDTYYHSGQYYILGLSVM